MDLDAITEPMEFDSRSAAESGKPNTIDKEDNVELEKSNVLLMGPTGSGIKYFKSTLINLCTPVVYILSPVIMI